MKADYSFLHLNSSNATTEAPPLISFSSSIYRAHRRRIVFHSRYVIGRLVRGSLRYHYNGYANDMRTDCVYLFQPDSLLVEQGGPEGCEIQYFHFDVNSIRWILDGFGVSPDCLSGVHEVVIDGNLTQCLRDLSGATRFRAKNAELKKEMIIDLMDLLVERIEAQEAQAAAPMPDLGLMRMKLSMLELCEPLEPEINRGSSFLHELGAHPVEVQSAVHAERARGLIESGLSILEVAKLLRMSCEQTLSDVFRQSWLLDPRSYQSLALARLA